MKKKYVKPELFFESFEMNTAIALCAGKVVDATPGIDTCRVQLSDGLTIFIEGNNCISSPDKGGWDSLCYDVPSDANKLFYS